jgi:hypothetical protein
VPLRSFAVERYRGFRERTRIEVRPLTLIFGYNSAGKSALVRLLPLVRDTLREGREPIFVGSHVLRQASFSDIHCRLSPTPVIALEFASDDANARYEIRHLADQRRQVIERVSMSREGKTEYLEWTSQGATYDRWVDDGPHMQVEVYFEGLTPHFHGDHEGLKSWRVPGTEDLSSVQWIDAVRTRVPRRMGFGARPRGPLASDGSDAPAALAFAREDASPVYETVRAFYQDHLSHTLEVTPLGDDFKVRVAPVKTPTLAIDLTDTGEGLSQVFPVVVALARAAHREGPTLVALEQPELHLHPAMHEELARWMCKLAKAESKPRMIVETHSENFLLSVLIALLNEEITTDDLIVYWVYQLDDGQSVVEPITFDELGRPQGAWPSGVFHEDAALATRLNTLRMERSRR